MHKNRVIKDLQMHKDVFSRCVKELEEFGLILYDPKSKTLDFASHAYNDSTTGLEIRGVGVAPLGERPKDGYE